MFCADNIVGYLRPCKAVIYENGKKKDIVGRFHCWGCSYEEFETGPRNFSTAIIELDNGQIVNCAAETVRFLDRNGEDTV